MLLHFLLFFLCKSTVAVSITLPPEDPTSTETAKKRLIVEATISSSSTTESPHLQLVANPDYPVASGQEVHLQCRASNMPNLFNWTLQHLENQIWKVVYIGRDLTLSEPEQSGLYRCSAETNLSQIVSPSHPVYIISMSLTGGEILGIAAFFISLLVLIISFAIILWLVWQRLGGTKTTSSTAARGFSGPEKPPNGGLPDVNKDNDVYMNYTSNNQAYTDLDPTNITSDDVYSCLS